MGTVESWNEVRLGIKEQRKQQVVREAIRLFKEQGFDRPTFQDIADRAGIGVASMYRYFKTRQDLIIASAELYWDEEIRQMYRRFAESAEAIPTGLGRCVRILELFLELYGNHPEFLRFLEVFDRFVVDQKISDTQLKDYDTLIASHRTILESAVNEGLKDGSVRAGIDVPLFCSGVLQTLIALSQKLISRKVIVPSDRRLDGEAELRLVIDMARAYLSPGSPPGCG